MKNTTDLIKEAGDSTLFFRRFLKHKTMLSSIVTNAPELLNFSVGGGR